MLSSRPVYNAELEFYRHSERGMSVALSQHSPLSEHYDTHSQLSQRTSPASESESKSGPAMRKRVPVACDRCRKRKIKCSGNENGKPGCSNCRNAGYTGCQFLRVQSVGLVIPQTSSRQYRYSPYPVSTSRSSYVSAQQPYHSGLSYGNLQNGLDYTNYPSSTGNVSWSRASYAATYPLQYDEDPPPQYTAQPPSYMLPNTDPMANGSAYFLNSQYGRSQQNGLPHSNLWPDQVAAVPSSNPHLAPNPFPFAANEAHTMFQPINSAVVSVPPTDRTLPTPAACRIFGAAPMSSLDSLPMSALSHRSSNGWNTDATSTASQASSRTSCTTGQESVHRSNTSCATQDMGFGYTCISHSPQETVPEAGIPATSNTIVSPRANRVSLTHDPATSRDCRRNASGESIASSPASSSYGHSSATRNRRSLCQSISSGHLINGREYKMFDQARPNATISNVRADCADYQTEAAQRTSVVSLSNNSSY